MRSGTLYTIYERIVHMKFCSCRPLFGLPLTLEHRCIRPIWCREVTRLQWMEFYSVYQWITIFFVAIFHIKFYSIIRIITLCFRKYFCFSKSNIQWFSVFASLSNTLTYLWNMTLENLCKQSHYNVLICILQILESKWEMQLVRGTKRTYYNTS